VLYQQANQKKIDKLEEQLTKERTSHQKAIDERKAQYQADSAENQARHDERITQLQTALAEERAILEQHRLDVAAVGEALKEDDISRLKRQFEQANIEATRNHQEQLARIQSQGTAQGSAYGTAMNDELRKKIEETKKLIEEATNAQAKASTAGSATATHWWTSFKDTLKSWFSGFPNLVAEWINNGASSIKAKTQHAFTGPMGGVGQLFSNAIDWITKREGGGPVQAGQPYIVGEREPELFVPRQSGQILNQQQIRQAISGAPAQGRSVSVQIGTVINQSNMDPDAFFSALSWHLG
jgi:chromosome segregation ATPase